MSSSSFIPIWTHWPTLQPKICQCHLSAFKLYRGLRFGTHTQIVSALTPTDFHHAWAIFGPVMDKNTQKGELIEFPASENFYRLFFSCFEIWIWNLVYTSSRWHDTWGLSFITIRSLPLESFLDFFSKCFEVSASKLVYTLSKLHNILSSCFTRMGSLWPSSCS